MELDDYTIGKQYKKISIFDVSRSLNRRRGQFQVFWWREVSDLLKMYGLIPMKPNPVLPLYKTH